MYNILRIIAIFTHPPLTVIGWICGFLWYPFWHVGFSQGYTHLLIASMVKKALEEEKNNAT